MQLIYRQLQKLSFHAITFMNVSKYMQFGLNSPLDGVQ